MARRRHQFLLSIGAPEPETRVLGNDAKDDKLESEGSDEGESGAGPEEDGLDEELVQDERNGEPEQGKSGPESDEELRSGAQEVPATKPHPVTGNRTWSGRTYDQCTPRTAHNATEHRG